MYSIRRSLFIVALFFCVICASRASSGGGSQTQFRIEEQQIVQQTGPSALVPGYGRLGYSQYDLNANVKTGGASLSAAPIISTPLGGSFTFPVGTNFSPTKPSGSGY